MYRASDDTSDVQMSTVPLSNASVSVSELPYDTDQCCNSGSHWDVGECTECLVTNEFGDSVVTSCDVCDDVLYIIKHSSTIIQPNHTSPANIVFNSIPISVGTLWDTDALQGSYMSTRVAKLLEEAGLKFDGCSTRVCTAFNNCKISDKMSTLALIFVNNEIEHLITFKVLEIPYDLIIGRGDMWKHKLWPRYAPYPYNQQYNKVIEHTSTSTAVLYQGEPNNLSELNQLSVPKVVTRLGDSNSASPSQQAHMRTSKNHTEPTPHRTVELREASGRVCESERARNGKLSTQKQSNIGTTTLAPKHASKRNKAGVQIGSSSNSDDIWEAALSEAVKLNQSIRNKSQTTGNATAKSPKEKKVQKTRQSEQHFSSIPLGEPKKALTEAQAKDADRYLQLWEVTTEEELNAFLGEYVKNTTGTINSEGAELKRAPISTFLDRELEGEGLAVRGADLPEYDTSTTDLRASDSEIPKATTSYIPKNLEDNGVGAEFAAKIAKICNKHLPVFNTKLNIQPADVPPLEIEVVHLVTRLP